MRALLTFNLRASRALAMSASGAAPAKICVSTRRTRSSQWHDTVRAPIWLRSPKTELGEQTRHRPARDHFQEEQLRPVSENIVFRWKNGLFLPVPVFEP